LPERESAEVKQARSLTSTHPKRLHFVVIRYWLLTDKPPLKERA